MKALLIFLVAAFSLSASAIPPPTMVLRDGNDTLTLTTTPCNPKVAALIRPEARANFRDAVAVVGGQTFQACWVLHSPEVIYVHFEDNDRVLIPLSVFSKTFERPKPKTIEDWRRSA